MSLYEFYCKGEKYRTNVAATIVDRLSMGVWVECHSRRWIYPVAIEWLRKRGLYVDPEQKTPDPS